MKEKNEVMEDFKNVLGYWEEAQERNKDNSRAEIYALCKEAMEVGVYTIKLNFDGCGDSWDWVDEEYYDKAGAYLNLKNQPISSNDVQSPIGKFLHRCQAGLAAAEACVCQAGFSGNDDGGIGHVTIDCLSLKTAVVFQWRETRLSEEEISEYKI